MTEILELPDFIKVRDGSFDWVQTTEAVRTRGRYVDQKTDPFPYWKADFVLPAMEEEDYGRFLSFIMKIRAGACFRAYKTNRPRPLAMDEGAPLDGRTRGGQPFDGKADARPQRDHNQIALLGLPPRFRFVEGDMVELFKVPEKPSLHMIGKNANANNHGIVQLQLNNPVPIELRRIPLKANFEKASCLMKVFEAPTHSRRPELAYASFTAQEVFL